MSKRAYTGADVFDGSALHTGHAVLLEDGLYRGIVAQDRVAPEYETLSVGGGVIMPGFVDLQVNGGGGVLFNEDTTATAVARIATAHARCGTHAFLPTLITDTPERTRAAIDAVEGAIANGVPGILGIHLEGPHLSIARKGAHDPELIRPMEAKDEAVLIAAARRLPNVMVTVAPENVTNDQISRLEKAGIIVSLGHTDCSFDAAEAAFCAGARCVTHLFNAMSQCGNREPGLVGAAICAPSVSCGLIADGIHVHAATMRMALSAKRGPGRIFLVTDAMAVLGSDMTEFALNGRRVLRHAGRLTLEDGTLAGADLDMITALSVLIERVGIPLASAYGMATADPAALLRDAMGYGAFEIGRPWRGLHIGADDTLREISA